MKNHKKVLEVFKEGIQTFLDVSVKQLHEKLIGRIPDSTNSGFTRFTPCYECNRENLKPRHTEDECPSKNFCLCKNRRRANRPCPNKVCDYIYEGIIENHMKFSPNLKTTTISNWTWSHWEIATCYMKHRSESVEMAGILDLLHLISNNKFILQALLQKADNYKKETTEEIVSIGLELDKCIKICRKIKRSTGMGSLNDIKNLCRLLAKINDESACKAIVELKQISKTLGDSVVSDWPNQQEFEIRVRNAVSKYFKGALNALVCKVKGEKFPLQLSFEQKLLVCKTSKMFLERQFTESDILDLIFGEQQFKQIFVYCENKYRGDSRWNEKDWFIFNVLDVFLNSGRKLGKLNCQYTDALLVSKSVSNSLDIPLETFCKGVKEILKESHNCLVLLDFDDNVVLKQFKPLLKREVFKSHTLVILLCDVYSIELKDKYAENLEYMCAQTQPVQSLTISDVDLVLKLRKDGNQIIQQCLFKCLRKAGAENLSTLTLEGIKLDVRAKTIKFTHIQNLRTLILKDCSLTPVTGPSLLAIEILCKETTVSNYLEQIELILYPALHSFTALKHIKTSGIRIGERSFCLKLKTRALEEDAKKYIGKELRACDKNAILDLLDIKVAKVLYAAGCHFEDFQNAGKNEKIHILNGIRYGLLKSDPNFVQVYPAECFVKGEQSHDIVFVCFMKENFDAEKESSYSTYRGFKTFLRSYNQVSPESLIAESSYEHKDESIEESMLEILRDASEVITHNSEMLMKEHSNLEAIGISMGKTRDNELDTAVGPYIVLYIRLKSFIPYGEKLFPETLAHPFKPSVSFNTDVREGYYSSLADCHGTIIHPLMKVPKLAMGCSIGFKRNQSAATLGPFVEIESGSEEDRQKNLGFLTVCHLFSLPSDYQSVIRERGKVVQPSYRDEKCVSLSNRNPEDSLYGDTECGEVVACEYSEEIDAALVKVTKREPQRSRFITCSQGDLWEAGFSDTPVYRDGSITSYPDCFRKNVVKIGKKTELTLGQCRFEGMVIRLKEDEFNATCPISQRQQSVVMKNLLQIGGFANTKFSDAGDSGAGVFLVADDNKLSCIGMIIGKTADNFTVATPIQKILTRLSGSPLVSTILDNCTITMKTFPA